MRNVIKAFCTAVVATMLVAGSLMLDAGRAAAAEVTIRIGWATTDAKTDAYYYAAKQFAAALENEAPGHFDVKYFPNRQLGDEKEMVQGMELGTVDAGIITNSIVANVEPAFLINDLPFLYTSLAQAHRVLDGPLGRELLDKLTAKGIIGLAFCESGFRNMINNVRPVNKPADVQGVKYRVMQSPIFIGMFDRLGGSAVPMAWGDVFTAAQQGTIDGLEIPTWVIAAAKLYEVTKYLSLTHHVYTAAPLLMSAQLFNRLDATAQQQVRSAAKKACVEQRAFNVKIESDVIKTLKAKGMIVNRVGDLQAFHEKMQPIYQTYRQKIGPKLMDAWMAALKQQ